MKTKNIKYLIHESIENIDDQIFLQSIQEIIERKHYPQNVQKPIPDYIIKELDNASHQIKHGDYLSNEEANGIIDKWLNQ